MSVTIQSVARALKILDTISRHPNGISIKETADMAGLNVSTTHHLIGTLENDGYTLRLENGKYCLGHTIARLYSSYIETINPSALLRLAVRELGELTKETAYVCTWENECAVIQDVVQGSQAVRVGGLDVGFMGHSHFRGSGKALLAFIDENEMRHYISGADFTPMTKNSVHNQAELYEQIENIRQQGYAIDQGEYAEEAYCVSAPVFNAKDRVIAALTISAPAQRFIHNKKRYIDTTMQIARKTSTALGYTSSAASRLVVDQLTVNN